MSTIGKSIETESRLICGCPELGREGVGERVGLMAKAHRSL